MGALLPGPVVGGLANNCKGTRRGAVAGSVVGSEVVVTTYCAMANLGIGYTPELEGRKLELEVPAQHGNNLVLRDNRTGEPIQQIYIAVITALVRAGIVTLNSIKNRS